jgi:hypothetical protein
MLSVLYSHVFLPPTGAAAAVLSVWSSLNLFALSWPPQVLRLQCERANLELASVRDDLARRIAAATEGADAVLNTAAGELMGGWGEGGGVECRSGPHQEAMTGGLTCSSR